MPIMNYFCDAILEKKFPGTNVGFVNSKVIYSLILHRTKLVHITVTYSMLTLFNGKAVEI